MAVPSTGDFSNADMQVLQLAFNQMFENGPAQYELNYPVPVLEKMLMEQTARPNLRLTGGVCKGAEVYWMQSGDHAATFNASTPPSLDCSLASGWKADAAKKSYDNNLFIGYTTTVDLLDCDNLIDVQARRNFQVTKTLLMLRQALQTKFINFLDTSKQTNTDAMLAAGNVSGYTGDYVLNADGKTIEVPLDEFKTPDALAYFRSVAENNGMYNYFLVAGRTAFHHERYNAQFRSLNDSERFLNPAFGAENMVTDTRTLDQTLGGANLFAVDPASFAFWNVNYTINQSPEEFLADKYRYYIQDPILTVLNPQGQRVPLIYEVEMQRDCSSSRDSLTRRLVAETHEIKVIGGLAGAPQGANSETGILKFKGAAV